MARGANGKPIVVAVDGSAPGWEAMETALSLAHLLNRPVEVLTCTFRGVSPAISPSSTAIWKDSARLISIKIMEEAGQRGQKAGVECAHLLEGEQDVSEIILFFLEGAGPVKFLVLGSHGHSFVSRHIIGSVTERVIREVAYRRLPVPVLVVPASAAAEAQTKA